MLMGDNVCVSNQQAFRDWPAHIPNVLTIERETSSLVAEIGLFSSLLRDLLVCGVAKS